ncbi:hypothetical protein L226DRAFT_439007, partial [Lentinus tigrinus ALCF2SS1-7]|uniref:uncharacterized protein n=1 Tax=Lentinus tigrinus ALCF2SS1-7 TaxID=1328758 RepID=UPI001165E3DB
DLPEASLSNFAQAVRSNLAHNPRLKEPFFMIELRGTKGAYAFDPDDPDDLEFHFNLFVERLNFSIALEDAPEEAANWYCDIGLEVSRQGHVLQWLTDAHEDLLRLGLPSVSDANLRYIMRRESLFETDLANHMFDLAGFRCHPGTRGRTDSVFHMNVYTTDKAVTYQLHRGAFTRHSPTDLFPGKIEKLLTDVDNMGAVFADCASCANPQDGSARFELRVNITKALHSIRLFSDPLLDRSILCIPSPLWWYALTPHMQSRQSAQFILQQMKSEPGKSRVLLPSLRLGAGIIYILNALNSRPSSWAGYQALAESCAL